ncbi:energy transducer TonB [Sphingomonas sp. CL5.1]|uniref:energy transducer TonB n=1 Tax=Sphingomonas sp. CL5.1 TaxID=2653203 RepID=UPI0015843B16|nr:energy transducer TonB [Sphingomonas sp. CL5.1]QKR99158.1 energy transducer TonB [Sphingomonas sp. CL5.1]
MYADRYVRSSGFNPGSLAVAVGLNAAIVAGLVMSVPEIRENFTKEFTAINIPIEPPPPPEPLPQPERKTAHPSRAATDQIDRTTPIVQTSESGGLVIPPFPPPTNPGTGGGIDTIIDPPVKPPVMVDAVADPRYARDFQPDYPAGERRMGNEGKVVIRVLVGADGRVKQVERVSAASEAFWQATERQALSRWRFRPATRDGVAVESWRTMTVRFEMES